MRNVLFAQSKLLQSGNDTAAEQNGKNKKRIRPLLLLLLPRMVSSSQPQIDDERQNFGLKAPIDVGNKLGKLKKKKKAKTHQPKKITVWQVTNVSCVMLCCSLPTCNNKSVLVLKNSTLFIFIFMSAS